MTVTVHLNDLPPDIDFGSSVAVDTETLGLKPHRDRLCVVQLSAGDGNAHLVQFQKGRYDAPNLKALLANPELLKIFHFGRFDIAVLQHYLGVVTRPGLLHQNCRKARAYLHGPAWIEGFVPRTPGCGDFEAAADLRLGPARACRQSSQTMLPPTCSIFTRSKPSSMRSWNAKASPGLPKLASPSCRTGRARYKGWSDNVRRLQSLAARPAD